MPPKGTEDRPARYIEIAVQFLKQYARSINSVLALLGAAGFVIHMLWPHAFLWIDPHLVAIFAVAILALLIDRIFVIERAVQEPPVHLHKSRIDAYEELSSLIGGSGKLDVDMIQFSGHSIQKLAERLAKSGRPVNLRILLMHPQEAAKFDPDLDPVNHLSRIDGTLGHLRVLHSDNPNFDAKPYFYRTPPGISGVLISNNVVSVGWYPVFLKTNNQLAVRGHDDPEMTATGDLAMPFMAMLRKQFEGLLAHAESAETWRYGGSSGNANK
jgi:hypothetical protein